MGKVSEEDATSPRNRVAGSSRIWLPFPTSDNPGKADQAEAVMAEGGAISVRTLIELTNVARRRMWRHWPEIHAWPALLRGVMTVLPLTLLHDRMLLDGGSGSKSPFRAAGGGARPA